jgi:hypothetical protein
MARWVEIQWQKTAIKQGPAVLLDPSVANYLQLSARQRTEIEELAKSAKLEAAEKTKQRHHVEAMRLPAAKLEKALAILSAEQRKQWDDMLGKPFRDKFTRLLTDPLGEAGRAPARQLN